MFNETAYVLAGLIESLPEDVPVDDPDADLSTETGSARTARERREAAERKRKERDRRRAAGIPEPRLVDAAIATAMGDIARRARFRERAREQRGIKGLAVGLDAILGQAMQELVEHRGVGQAQAKRALMQRLGLAR